jgi:hypothetical protein
MVATINELREFARIHPPSVLCVVETQLTRQRVEGLARTLGYDRSFAISSSGRSGGIGILWSEEIKIEILPYSQYHLDAIVSSSNMELWRLTCVYGEACDKVLTCQCLRIVD